jgi:hypothetical protein
MKPEPQNQHVVSQSLNTSRLLITFRIIGTSKGQSEKKRKMVGQTNPLTSTFNKFVTSAKKSSEYEMTFPLSA